jgi:hypothetical protein
MRTGFYEEGCMDEEKKEVETGRRVYIPDEHLEKVAELVDANKEQGKLTRYRLWKFIEEIIPETKVGEWALNTSDAIQYFVEEQL